MPIPPGWKPRPRAPDTCRCGVTYAEFRTHLTFADVREMMWVADDDFEKARVEGRLRRRSRGNVLGYWHELKLMFWWSEHGRCER